MSYCVHCGVKLGEGENRCPLCGTAVMDPNGQPDPAAPRAYPVRTPEQELRRNKWFLLTCTALLTLLPAMLCLIIDWVTGGGIGWSIYAAGALILLFISAAVPLTLNRHKISLTIPVSFLCLSAYLFMAEKLSSGSGWFFPIVLPALALTTAMLSLLIWLYRRDTLNKLTLLAASLAAVAALCLAVELLRIRAYGLQPTLIWSPYVVAPCVFVSLVLFFINSNRPIREEVRRRVHF